MTRPVPPTEITRGATPRRLLFGLPLDALTLDDVLNRCDGAIKTRQRLQIGVVNAAKIVNMGPNPMLRDALLACDVLVADGMSVVWASRVLQQPLPERVAGIDIFERLLEQGARLDRSAYFLGARPDILARLEDVVARRFPGLRIAGSRDGYFTDDESAEVAADIRASGADMLFLGMTSPKKEMFLGRYGDELSVPVLHGVGGSFDVLAGITRRAPERWQRMGMEWSYRLLQEPRRMWRRYLVTNSTFVAMTLHALVRHIRRP
jgi:N-acetylglucosaminyldiphosphoundecaprenol N-acetyl-beta-D-mannosaminyltransferase